MRACAVLLLLLLCGVSARAQEDGVPRDVIEQRIEAAADQLGGEVDLTTLFEQLTDHYKDPIDLNHTDAQELSTLLLTDIQISSICTHQAVRQVAEPQRTADRGRPIATGDQPDRPFVAVRENPYQSTASIKEIFANGTSEWTTGAP
ncbi:MAG: hypothetical protein IPH63_10450 [Flavobacteriales bacterium]|nr:hypothetical protein [Flavobacteriales bacterium]